MNLASTLTDPELGFTGFTVLRTTYRLQNGESVPSTRTIPVSGCVHPGMPETLQLLPEEERAETFIEIYTGFNLSEGENNGGAVYTAPDRILWNGETWRVVKVRDWSGFGYVQAAAVKIHEESRECSNTPGP